ncbi:MAG: hypothetical protein JXR84_20270 [Anaerolineae bacterium]|nr:hypothetical protein [Anaerolineae bacterium]
MTQMQTTWRDIDVSAYVDGELDPGKQAAFEAALAQDHALRQKVKEMREVVALMRAAPLCEPPRNYLLTPSMVTEKSVAEKSPQRKQRRPVPLLFMRLATSLAALAFVATAGLTYIQQGIVPTMMSEAPQAADEMPVLEAPRAMIATVEVTKEVEVMRASEPEGMPEEPASIAEDVQVEKAVEAEQPAAALATVPSEATPQPSAGGADIDDTTNAQEREETAPQAETLALESPPAAEKQVVGETEGAVEDGTGTLSATGEEAWQGDNATEPIVEEYHETVTAKRLQASSWWLPTALGTVTLLLAGITYWMSRRR